MPYSLDVVLIGFLIFSTWKSPNTCIMVFQNSTLKICTCSRLTFVSFIFFSKNYAQTLVDADRTSLFLVDNRTNELYARIFDIGGSLEDSRSSNLQKEIRY